MEKENQKFSVKINLAQFKTDLFTKKKTYKDLADFLKISIPSVQNKLSGKTQFNIQEFFDACLFVDRNIFEMIIKEPIQ